MMTTQTKKLIIFSAISVVVLGIILVLMLVDIPKLNLSSVKTLLNKNDEIVAKEAELTKEKAAYNTLLKNLENSKASFEKEKSKYDAISDDTIKIIRDSNTEENYSLEYLWVKIGDYAKRNSLSLVLIEPGNKKASDSSETSSDKSVVATDNTVNTNTSGSENSGVLTIQVTGEYTNLADFVFQIENDSELRFKLDNINMALVSDSSIKLTFEVRDIIVYK